MNKFVRNILSLSLALSMCITICVPSFAEPSSSASCDFWCSDIKLLSEMLSVSNPSDQNVSRQQVDYNYRFYAIDSANPEVELSFSLPNSTITVSTSGKLILTPLTDCLTLAEAHLYDTKTIDGTAVTFNIAFIKILERDGATITATVSADGFGDLVFLSLGETVLKEDVMSYIPDFNRPEALNISDLNAKYNFSPAAISSYSQIKAGFADDSALNAQTMYFKSDSAGRATVVITSNRNNAAALALSKSTFQNALAQIESVESKLSRNNGSAFIAGVEKLAQDNNNITGSSSYLDLVTSILSDLGVPTSVISFLIDSMKNTSINVSHRTDQTTVSWSSKNGLPDLDKSGFPVVFQLNSNLKGTSSFTASTNISYKVYLYNRGQDGRWYYFDANQANKTFSWTKQ